MSKIGTVDVFAFTGAKLSGLAQLNMNLLESGGSVCTGIQNLIQEWLILMLTPKGSVVFDENRGSNFLPEAMNATVESDIKTSFVFANADVIEQLRRTSDDKPDDEIVDKVTLDTLNLKDGLLSVKATITSKAGESRTVTLPIHNNPIIL